jgi:hypothetical protein
MKSENPDPKLSYHESGTDLKITRKFKDLHKYKNPAVK